MQSFTFGSDEGMEAVVYAHRVSGEAYPMTLNVHDLQAVMYALREFSLGETYRGEDREEIEERAMSLMSGIAETLGIEFV